MVVLSLWRDNLCAGTFRLSVDEVPDLIAMLRTGLAEAYAVARDRAERGARSPTRASRPADRTRSSTATRSPSLAMSKIRLESPIPSHRGPDP